MEATEREHCVQVGLEMVNKQENMKVRVVIEADYATKQSSLPLEPWRDTLSLWQSLRPLCNAKVSRFSISGDVTWLWKQLTQTWLGSELSFANYHLSKNGIGPLSAHIAIKHTWLSRELMGFSGPWPFECAIKDAVSIVPQCTNLCCTKRYFVP